jgi:hypothetical protein
MGALNKTTIASLGNHESSFPAQRKTAKKFWEIALTLTEPDARFDRGT